MCPRPPVRHVALLRGINVGKGARIAMADLAACTAEAGCADVRTVLSTGNVVFSDAPAVTERVAGTMHAAIEEPGTEAVAAGPGLLYWRCRRGSTLSSPAGKVLDSRENKAHLTTRNLRTLRRILAAG